MPLMLALRKVGNQWSLLVLSELLEGPRRFSEIQTAVPKSQESRFLECLQSFRRTA